MAEDDDLHRLDDEALVRALRAPGTPTELGEQERYVAMYRDDGPGPGSPQRRRGGAGRRLGTGTALVIVLGVAGGGVAAAYTGNLPDPLQDFAHSVLGPVAPPPAEETDRKPGSTVKEKESAPLVPAPPTTSPAPSATPSPSQAPTSAGPTAGPEGSVGGSSAAASPSANAGATSPASPTPSPSAPASPSPTPTPTPTARPVPDPAGLSISGTTHQVDVAQVTALSGIVSARDGTPVANVKVQLQRRGPDGWSRVAKTLTDRAGGVSFTTPPAAETTAYRLRTRRAHSSPWRVAMHPLLTLTSGAGQGEDSVVITASAQGGQAGDRVRLLTRRANHAPVVVAEGFLGAYGSVQLEVTETKRRTRYLVVLEGTSSHTRSHAGILVTKPPRALNSKG